jgi:hypothetical protein
MSIKNEKRPRDGWGSTVHLGLKGTCYHSRFKGGVRADNKSHIISTISSSHLTVITSAALGAIFWPKIQEPCDPICLSLSLTLNPQWMHCPSKESLPRRAAGSGTRAHARACVRVRACVVSICQLPVMSLELESGTCISLTLTRAVGPFSPCIPSHGVQQRCRLPPSCNSRFSGASARPVGQRLTYTVRANTVNTPPSCMITQLRMHSDSFNAL